MEQIKKVSACLSEIYFSVIVYNIDIYEYESYFELYMF